MILLIEPDDLHKRTQINANVDVQKYIPYIEDVQVKVMGDLLGDTLKNKILDDFDNDALTGLYEKVYKILKNIIIYQTASDYILFNQYHVSNGGVYKLTSEDTETVEVSEVESLSRRYYEKSQLYVSELNRFLCSEGGKIPEYNTQDETYNKRPQRGINDMITWHLD